MAASPSDSDAADLPTPLERMAASPPIHSEPICRAWAELNFPPETRREMGAGGRRHSLLDDEIYAYHLYRQYRLHHRLKYASGHVMVRGLRLKADKFLERIQRLRSSLPPVFAPSAPRKRSQEEAEVVDEHGSYIRPQTKKLKLE
ncbi:hypothetical protein R3P38DRAFT_3225586 [Favolaschia claudopus]|uniref:Uncharacterized protein n=1 Tax=Favolaschia claudopus TaxID=2862362 RepID=A0AAV9ZU49_9AGAR